MPTAAVLDAGDSHGPNIDKTIPPMSPAADVEALRPDSVIVETPLTTIPEGSALTVCALMVAAGPPTTRVADPTTIELLRPELCAAVKAMLPSVRIACAVGGCCVGAGVGFPAVGGSRLEYRTIEPPKTMPDGPRLIVFPETVAAGAFVESVEPSMTKGPEAKAVTT